MSKADMHTRISNQIAGLLFFSITPLLVEAQILPPRFLKFGDTWVYQRTQSWPSGITTSDKIRIFMIGEGKTGKMLIATSNGNYELNHNFIGATMASPTIELDSCITDLTQANTLTVAKDCKEPAPGKYHITDKKADGSNSDLLFTIHKPEELHISNGKFTAVKIDKLQVDYKPSTSAADGPEQSTSQPSEKKRVLRKKRTTFWYALSVKAMVKIVRETLDENENLTYRMDEELVKFTPAQTNPSEQQ